MVLEFEDNRGSGSLKSSLRSKVDNYLSGTLVVLVPRFEASVQRSICLVLSCLGDEVDMMETEVGSIIVGGRHRRDEYVLHV